jgi:hypothetical protein
MRIDLESPEDDPEKGLAPARLVLRGHTELIQALAVSAGGMTVASGNWGGMIKRRRVIRGWVVRILPRG